MSRMSCGFGACLLAVILGTRSPAVSAGPVDPSSPPVKLVVWITVDQMRGDMPWRYVPHSSADGFRSLLRRGAFFRSARFEHGITFTAVGHATLFTGGHVPDHGIAGNEWFDASLRRSIAAIQDDRYPIVGQPPADGKGCSPANLTSTTIGDELVLASGGRSRVFSVSAKDRGAILPGGYFGKAFWYSTSNGQYVTSTYYYKEYPDWVARWNAARPADAFRERAWTLLDDPTSYRNAARDDRPCERGYKHLKRTFPHPIAAEKPADLYAAIAYTPFSDELTIQFAEELLRREQLGRRDSVDLLAISLSATDQIGHAWGPESLEAEDNTRRVDALLGRFFRRLDETVGLQNTLVILAADHGMDDIPECAEALGLPAGRHYPAQFMRSVNDGLKARFRIDVDLVTNFWSPSLYFDLDAVQRLGLDLPAVEQAAAEEIMKVPGMAYAVTRTALLQGRVPAGPLGRAIGLSFHPERSGGVLIFAKPFWYLYHDPEYYAATHGSPYAYDTFVPVLVAGPGIPVRTVNRTISPADLAPTVAAYLGIKPPSGCTGNTIEELLQHGE